MKKRIALGKLIPGKKIFENSTLTVKEFLEQTTTPTKKLTVKEYVTQKELDETFIETKPKKNK